MYTAPLLNSSDLLFFTLLNVCLKVFLIWTMSWFLVSGMVSQSSHSLDVWEEEQFGVCGGQVCEALLVSVLVPIQKSIDHRFGVAVHLEYFV